MKILIIFIRLTRQIYTEFESSDPLIYGCIYYGQYLILHVTVIILFDLRLKAGMMYSTLIC